MENLNQTTILKGDTPEEQLQSIGEDIKDFSPIKDCPNTLISKDKKRLVVIELCDDNNWEKTIEKVILLNSITKIGDYTFRDFTSLQKVVIPDSVIEIGSSAFEGCKSLQNIVIPDSVKRIGSSVFRGCQSLSLVTLPRVYSNITDILSGYSGDLVIKSVMNNYTYEDGLLIEKSKKKLKIY